MTKSVNTADGSYGNITWSIDGDGQLTVTGTGDFSAGTSFTRAPWYDERKSIKSAVIKVTGMTNTLGMFYGCSSLYTLDLSSFNTGNVTNMSNMFSGCRGLVSLNLNIFATGKVTDMSSMFSECSHLNSLDVSGFDTGKVTSMRSMFANCNNLPSLSLSSFNTSNVTDLFELFSGRYNLATIYTPFSVTQSVSLPGFPDDIWYMSDGTQITELPQNLNDSILITKNKVPTQE